MNFLNKKGILSLVMATILFSSMEVALKLFDGGLNSIQLNFLRFFSGAFILMPFSISHFRKKGYHLTWRDFLEFILMGFLCIVVSMSLYIMSVPYIPAFKLAVLFCSNTFVSIFLASLFLNEKIGRLGGLALVITFVGMMAIIDPLHFGGDIKGVVICLTSAVSFSLYGIFCKVYTKDKPFGGGEMTSFVFLLGALELLVLILISEIPQVSDFLSSIGLGIISDIHVFRGLRLDILPMLLYIIFGVTGAGFATYFVAMDTLSVSMASLVFFIKPVLAPVMAYFVLGEVISAQNIVGICIILVGSAILFFSGGR